MSTPPARTRALILSRPAIVAALLLAFGLILGTALLTALSTRDITATDDRANHAQRSLVASTQALARIAEMDSAARAALLSSDATARAAYLAARERVAGELAALARQYERGHELQPLFLQLQKLALDRAAGWDDRIAAGPRALNGENESEDSQRALEEIRRLTGALQRQEFSALAEQSALAAGRAETIQRLNLGLLTLAVTLAGALAWWLLRRVRDFEALITVCAWTRRVLWQGRWISFEEYLVRRFDLRCTHGICDEAAEKLKAEIGVAPPPLH